MPLLLVQIITWHGVCRILVIYLFVSQTYSVPFPPEYRFLGILLIFIAYGFLLLTILILAPPAMGANSSPEHQIRFCIGIILATLAAFHDTIVGLELANGGDYVFHTYLDPIRSKFPALYRLFPLIALYGAIAVIVFGGIWIVRNRKWRTYEYHGVE